MKRRRAVQLDALGGLTLPLAGCTDEASQSDENSSETDDADETADEDDADEDTGDGEEPDADGDEDEGEESADEPDEQEFSGSGDDAVEGVSVEGGLTVVDAAHEGEGDFEVRLIPEERLADEDADDAEGDETGGEAEGDDAGEDETDAESVPFVYASGEYEGQTGHPVDEGTYVLSVVADGDWEVTVRQPRAESGDEPPISLSGDGNEVHGPFEFDGSHQPSGDYDGERIVANVYSPSGDTTVFAFNESNIENPSEFEFEGVGYVTVKSDGEWEVEIE